ncbi:MAG: hypothetical protein A3C71_02820 [Candidatus Yanofskybacteria bacterium RIFCSPHIGHO2_02_FULL_43_15c]|uniref:Uncharacterized protein n=2 Tax=Candidatus Yanofskyibacteriota TaxID=1752733 RepID=A0A1F8ECU3_9BACT|nr:MAG: hypothetical protein A2649_00165 [Candidatus Yanofskybacteria bacterium RIFCSPHIGHO2_01_FULL_41_26]OGN12765.1 MAG: hypothetical protein A3C71_02820 [Candidatus Yanofskybacteria bacterium RIFCSPHIGHO2_02_FULL_43_15c]OGN21464.1 MAG: hypothetical protein A2915_02080 [Candidatus Yanofskybacteria bacterium RIFCSPLOWO2_01_FULL_41_34]
MKSEFSVGLADRVCATWDAEGGTPAELNNFAENNALVRGLLTILRGGAVVKPIAVDVSAKPHVIPIDRSKLFNPATFIGAGWSVWRGPASGDGLEGEEERDLRSAALAELGLDKVQLVTCLKRGESVMTGEVRVKRLKSDGRIRLDENAFKAFWENREQLPARFKERVNGDIQFIFFDGVVLRSPDGDRCVLCLCFDGGGSWGWGCDWLGRGRSAGDPSAVLASQN